MSVFRDDKIRVFISSTIRECAEERDTASRAIASLNHLPVLFENLGARSHAPRDMYMRGIEESQIFVAIYKDSRGWIAADMEISGIEDEYRHATRRGMPRLVYMKEDAGGPPPWLGELADTMAADKVSVFFFKDAEGLFRRIRDDIEAVVADVFLGRGRIQLARPNAARDVLGSLLSDEMSRLRRDGVEQGIVQLLDAKHRVLLHGPMGIGKTVLMAQLAETHGFTFLSAGGLSNTEIAAMAANLLWEKVAQEPPRFLSPESAAAGFASAWKAVDGFTLAIDGCDEPEFFLNLAQRAGGFNAGKRLLLSAASAPETFLVPAFLVPSLEPAEVRTLVEGQSRRSVSPTSLVELFERSRGNPLYLRYAVSGDAAVAPSSIEEYEKEHWLRLPQKAKELVTHVMLADQPLPMDSIARLIGVDSVEALGAPLTSARHLLREERGGFVVFHDHLRQTLRTLLAENPAKHAYYANRLAEQLKVDGDYVGAFLALDRAGDPKAVKLAQRAAFQAQVRGDVRAAVRILEARWKQAVEVGDIEDQVLSLLSLSQVRLLGGDKDGATSSLSLAQSLVANVQDERVRRMLEEQKLMLSLRVEPTLADIERLQSIKAEHLARDDRWAAARAGVDLSEIYIRLGNYLEAAAESEEALAWFLPAKDGYGISVARANLAAALTAIPGQEERAAKLLAKIRRSVDEQANLRGKAWIRNMLARRLRHAGEYGDAASYAAEAIALGDQLGDKYVISVNRITLGNILRDANRLDEALVQYDLAAGTAQQAAFRDTEAVANELTASVLNQKGEHAMAESYARVAAGLVRGTAAVHTFAKAMEELGTSLHERGDPEAVPAYLEAARALTGNANHRDYFYELGLQGLFAMRNGGGNRDYFDYIDKWLGLDGPPESGGHPEAFYHRVPGLLERVDRNHLMVALGIHFRRMFEPAPLPAARYLIGKLLSVMLYAPERGILPDERLLAMVPLIAAAPSGVWKPGDIVQLGERLFSAVSGIAFKAQPDGAVHWVVRLGLATPVVCSVQQVDTEPSTALVATLLVLFLRGFQDEIQRQVVLSSSLPRREIAIQVLGTKAFKEHVTSDPTLELPSEERPCVVSRPTSPKDRESVPTVVICHDDIAQHWHAGRGSGSAIQLVFGLTLLEIVYQLFEGEVDMEALRPKIVSVVRRSIA